MQTSNMITALAFSPDSQSLVAGSGVGTAPLGQVIHYDYPTGKVRHVFTAHDNVVSAVAVHPSGQWIVSAGGNDKEIAIWHTTTGKEISWSSMV